MNNTNEHNNVQVDKDTCNCDSFKEDNAMTMPTRENLCSISISYCCGCRWQFRANWLLMELLSTFTPPNVTRPLVQITLIPIQNPAGTFIVKVNNQIVWDRKEKGRFPDAKEIKQIVRSIVAPDMSLGHSDKPS